jgi:hypothetical protein
MDLKTVAAKLVGTLADQALPLSGPFVEGLIAEVLRAEEDQLAILRGVDRHVQQLIDGPLRTAHLYLEDAAVPGRSPEQVRQSLMSAADRLHDAIPLQPEASFASAQVCLELAFTFRMLNDAPASAHYAEKSYRSARRAIWTWVNTRITTDNKRVTQISDPVVGAAFRWYEQMEWAAAALGGVDLAKIRGKQEKRAASVERTIDMFADDGPPMRTDEAWLRRHRAGLVQDLWIREFWRQPELVIDKPSYEAFP